MATTPTTTVSTADVPDIIKPQVTKNLADIQNLTDPNQNPYSGLSRYYTETGESPFAEFNPLQKQAFDEAAKMGPDSGMGEAKDIASGVGAAARNVGSDYARMATDPNAISSYMSPYTQNVIEQQKNAAISDYARAIPGMGANAARVGGIGGSRSALVQAEGQRNLGNQLSGIEATGLNNAYNTALQNMQFGTNAGIQGLGIANAAAGTLGNLGYSNFMQGLEANKNRSALGSGIQNTENLYGSMRYADWQNEKNYPLTSALTYSGALKNVPFPGNSGTSTTTTPSSSSSNFLGNLAGFFGGFKTLFG